MTMYFRRALQTLIRGRLRQQQIAQNNLGTKVAIIYDSSTVYSSGIAETFTEEAKKLGIEIVAEEAFTADSKTDFSTQLKKAQSAERIFLVYADLLYRGFRYSDSGRCHGL